ncbi:MAG: glycine/sarcosine/betaine reductase selenoprotein B family protein [Anaerolineales bacterium]
MMEILENKARWSEEYRAGWLAHQKKTGEANWGIYNRPTNNLTPGLPGIKLNEDRLMLISSAGGYLLGHQEAFDAPSPYGDYTVRTFPSDTPFDALAFAHDHYDLTYVTQDPQVALPLHHLKELVTEERIGKLAPSIVSIMGYQPDSARVVDETIPQILSIAEEQAVQAALLAPV